MSSFLHFFFAYQQAYLCQNNHRGRILNGDSSHRTQQVEPLMLPDRFGVAAFGRFLIVVAGFGGLLYGIDVGIIAAALLYLSKTVSLTLGQTSIIVAAVLGGSMFSSVIAGLLADWLGRRTIMIGSALMFLASIGLIVLSQSFAVLPVGRCCRA